MTTTTIVTAFIGCFSHSGVEALYSYDVFNRNSMVGTIDGNVQINRYDAEGLRHELEENGRLVQFIFNNNREVVAEQDENKWMLYIRASSLLASSTDHARTYYHYASDEMGSTTHIVDGEGAVQNRYVYDAWGNATEQTENVPNRFKFNGQQLDSISQQYYLRARFYNPVIARFTQEDTYRGDGLNLYAYCANNPVYYADPSGNEKGSPHKPQEPTAIVPYDPHFASEQRMRDGSIYYDASVNRWRDSTTKRFVSTPTSQMNRPQSPQAATPNGNPTQGAISQYSSAFTSWLNQGPNNNSLYFGMDFNNTPQYIGITQQNLPDRLYQHNNLRTGTPKGFRDLMALEQGLTRNQARALEQYFIENGPNALNKINSIDKASPYYSDAMKWAEAYVNSKGGIQNWIP